MKASKPVRELFGHCRGLPLKAEAGAWFSLSTGSVSARYGSGGGLPSLCSHKWLTKSALAGLAQPVMVHSRPG